MSRVPVTCLWAGDLARLHEMKSSTPEALYVSTRQIEFGNRVFSIARGVNAVAALGALKEKHKPRPWNCVLHCLISYEMRVTRRLIPF
jgi:hypothetical protein